MIYICQKAGRQKGLAGVLLPSRENGGDGDQRQAAEGSALAVAIAASEKNRDDAAELSSGP